MTTKGKAGNHSRTLMRKVFGWFLVLCMVFSTGAFTMQSASAAAGDVPDHDKNLIVNDDGTYTIALNVTGDSEKQIQKVNVIVIVDRSGSMNEQSGTGAYVPSNQNGTNMYGLIDGEYVPLTRVDNGRWANPRYTYFYNGTQYTGQRYQYDGTATRLQATKAAIVELSGTLLDYNSKEGNPSDTVEMALVSFATGSATNVASTTSKDTYINAVNGLTVATGQQAGTNWESALQRAQGIDFGDSDPTYVIFFSDGAPTFYGNTSGSGQEEEPNMSNSYNAATNDAAALATKVGPAHFYTIFAYGSDAGRTYMTNLTEAAGAPAGNNYSASNTAELNDAFAEILESIESAGIGAVSLNDGTTSSVETTTGEISNLLTVDESSYKYYRAGGTDNDGNEKYDHTANGGLGEEWPEKSGSNTDGAPAATFENGAVKWDLSSVGVLENDVTYTVTFDCWPSQTTLDIAADLKNNPDSYDELDENIQKFITRDGSLRTNTTATLSYTDTRNGQSSSQTYDNPDPVTTSAIEQLAISKEWENELDSQSAEPITLTVTRDTKDHHTMTLSADNDWKASTYISIGILRHNENGDQTDSAGAKYEVLETGHDFTFTEPADLGYYWEIDVPTVRPMLVDGTVTMLILKEGKYNNPDNTTEYTIGGKTYYTGETGEAALTATNNRRARLNLTKVVDGEDADPDQVFPFTLNVADSKASEGSEDNLNSDYYVWFSIYNGGYVDGLVSGAEKEITDDPAKMIDDTGWTGFYYAPSGTDIVVNLKAGDNLRFLNLPTGSTYTFTEGTMPDNYAFTSSELTAGEDSTFSGAKTTTGTIEATNTDYTVTYTNTYALTDIEITKVWVDADNQDGKRPTPEAFKNSLVLKADGQNVTAANASKLTVVADATDTNKYLVKWTGLDRYADGEEITYTVEENTITGYTTTGSPANDKGTITNSHTPEVTEVTATKTWSDADNQDGKRPETLELTLNGAPEGTTVPAPTISKSGNNWTYTWSGLPKYAEGQEIAYTISENTVPAGYTKSPEAPVANGGTITNSYTPEVTTVTATKTWSDANNQDGKRPESLTLTLNGLPEGATAPEPTVTKNGNSWTYTWSGLPKYAAGEEIEYTISEDTVPAGYTKSPETAVANGGIITNSYTPEVTEATVKKVWDDSQNQDGVRPGSVEVTLSNGTKVTLSETNNWTQTVSGLPKYADGEEITYSWTETVPEGYTVSDNSTKGTVTTITNTHTPSTIDISGTKTWDDADDQDGYRPDSITVNLLANGEKVDSKTVTAPWTYEFTGVPEYANGQKITYTVSEEAVDKYNPTYTGYNIKNTHVPEVVDVSVEKVWDDADDQDGKRPASVTVNLLADGEQVDSVVLNADNSWKHTFANLPKNASGEAITYTVEEEEVEYYTPTIEPAGGTDESGEAGTGDGEGTTEGGEATEEPAAPTGYIITNVHEPEKISIDVTKTWDDNDDQDGKRPGSITFNLLADGTKVTSASVTADDDWAYTFEDLPKYSKGKEIKYTITEDAVTDYTTTVNGYAVTNKHTPEKTSISVKKVWDDADDRDKIRPDSVTVNLLANGEAAGTATLSESNNWAYTFSGLDKYSKGQQITYTVAEDEVAEYEVEVTGTAAVGYTLKNYHQAKPDKVMSDPPVQKVVTGKPGTPATFTFQMKALTDGAPMPEGSVDGVKTMQITGSGSKEFGEMYFEEAGEWVYEISEVNDGIKGYTYDSTVYTLTVKVEEVADGTQVKLVKTETIEGGDGSIVFTNEYKEPAEPAPKTGDKSMTTVALLALLASATVLGLFRARRKEER